MADYLLEQLGPDRFQNVCQALLVKAFPKTQCFPIGQRDGGRDAVSLFSPYDDADDFVVYQVKFVHNPQVEKDPHRKLTNLLEDEAPKIRELIPKGAKEYYLLTNITGTAYPDAGSIDLVQSILSKHIPIPAHCWWRDDINRRLDDAWDIKWTYPEILRGTDILKFIIEHGLGEHAERRTAAIKAYVRDQFTRDTEVRFKQVDLQNKLLDLFVDVPIDFRGLQTERWRSSDLGALRQILHASGAYLHDSTEPSLGAASLFLHPVAQARLRSIVVEGAPGQGKSTIVQYVCQIHRGRILGEDLDDERVPIAHRTNPLRLPLKLDCRDLAVWLNHRNPFSADDKDPVPKEWHKSLESFLAAQITQYSGGSEFTVADLHAVARIGALLLVCDGLDEVADIARRSDVVDEIAKGVTRLSEIAVSLQTIVTSRPAAFANAPGFPEDKFQHLQLGSITRPLIDQYADKWLKARRLDVREAADVRRILKNKVDQPHLRELARNPMQLAILLSLIQTRGGSLPDKRTALYDSYVDLFFNREAEKSTIVRDHRDLLIDIHRYLAWILHSEAQTKETTGSVSAQRLQQLVRQYLADEGHNVDLAQLLFTGMVERVVALVSRIEGTYEFEVQPLREYFAARHLYTTAPYSPPGGEKRGTLPDRFDALCRDFFWQNVSRFYAGCYSKGELPSLVDRLEELSRAPGYKFTSHAQVLAATLLSDWVFAQHPRSMKQVVSLVIDGCSLKRIVSIGRSYQGGEMLILPTQNGKEELIARCVSVLREMPPRDYAAMLIELWRANSSAAETVARWFAEIATLPSKDCTSWMRYGLQLGILPLLSEKQLTPILSDPTDTQERLSILQHGGRSQFIEADEGRIQAVVDELLDSTDDPLLGRSQSLLEAFTQIWVPGRLTIAFNHRFGSELQTLWQHYYGIGDVGLIVLPTRECLNCPLTRACSEMVSFFLELAKRPASEWATSVGPWETLLEGGRERFGERWRFFRLASIGAGIRSKEETCDEATELFDDSVPLVRRARYARLRAASASWWQHQLSVADNPDRKAFALLLLLGWSGASVIERLAEQIDQNLVGLDARSWERVSSGCAALAHLGWGDRRSINLDVKSLPGSMSDRTAVLLTLRSPSLLLPLGAIVAANYKGDDPIVLEFCQHVALCAVQNDRATWRSWLSVIAWGYKNGSMSDRYFAYGPARMLQSQQIPTAMAEEIAECCDQYPAELVSRAIESCRRRVAERVAPVGAVAGTDRWFEA